jgi:4-hydroxy-3-methylbut-2-enyl diphosphate reductase
VESARKDLDSSSENLYFLGDIVHNKQVVDELKDKGAIFIDDINEAKSTTIIRAHGVPKEVYEMASKKNIKLKDYKELFNKIRIFLLKYKRIKI